jgi:UDP-N-acetylmuramoyl-L-alanyl-D-glutamate--2,6-diaminopimelate ligase
VTPTRPEHPPRTPLREVVDWLGPEAHLVGEAAGEVTGVTLSSRSVLPGDLYVAPQGGTAHGARYAGAAVEAGARAVLTDEAGAVICRETGVRVPVVVVPPPPRVVGAQAAPV